jgi:hypothetical protein
MARLKKASRPLTGEQPIDAALKLLVLSRKKFKLPALSEDEREQCCMHIGELADTMASVRADAERPRPTRATYRAALAALKRHKKTSEAVTAAGGGVASLDIHRTETHHSGRLSTGGALTCVDIPDWPATPPPIRSRNTPFARSRPRAHPTFEPNRPARPLRSYLPAPHPEVNSP